MTGFIPNQATQGSGVFYSTASESVVAQSHHNTLLQQDTITEIQQQAKAKQKNTPGLRAQLPAPHSKLPPDDLMILAAAYCKAFNAMSEGVITQTKDFTQLQELDQTQTKCVLDAANNAIEKQQVAVKISGEVAEYAKKMAEANKWLGWVMGILGAIVMVVTIASSFFDGGASDAALPEEMEMFDLGGAEDVADDVGDGASGVEDDMAMDDLNSGSEISEESGSSSFEETQESTTHANVSSENAFLKFLKEELSGVHLGKLGFKLAVGAGFGSPMLMKGISSLTLFYKLRDLSTAQAAVGKAMGLQQQNNMYFQFLQQLMQREGGVITQETDDTSEVLDTFASITNAYRAIPQGLANAI